MSGLEKFTQLFNKKYIAIVTVLSLLIGLGGLYYNIQKKPGSGLTQFLSVSITNIKQSIFS